jgi:hypothetical protein
LSRKHIVDRESLHVFVQFGIMGESEYDSIGTVVHFVWNFLVDEC